VRNFLGGSFENSAFCILAPDGVERLTASGRGPHQVFRSGRGGGVDDAIEQMAGLAESYRAKGRGEPPLLADFDSFRQGLNVASADQRVFVVLAGEGDDLKKAQETMRPIAWSDEIIGRFHYDSAPEKGWDKAISGVTETPGIHVVLPAEFGQEGKLHKTLPLNASESEIRQAMLAANAHFAKTTEPKIYSSHVTKGRSEGVYFEGAVPYGEDRDGDGEIDQRGGGKGR